MKKIKSEYKIFKQYECLWFTFLLVRDTKDKKKDNFSIIEKTSWIFIRQWWLTKDFNFQYLDWFLDCIINGFWIDIKSSIEKQKKKSWEYILFT